MLTYARLSQAYLMTTYKICTTVSETTVMPPVELSSDDGESSVGSGFKTVISLSLTLNTPAVSHNITRLCWFNCSVGMPGSCRCSLSCSRFSNVKVQSLYLLNPLHYRQNVTQGQFISKVKLV